jgi:hypothetical protein
MMAKRFACASHNRSMRTPDLVTQENGTVDISLFYFYIPALPLAIPMHAALSSSGLLAAMTKQSLLCPLAQNSPLLLMEFPRALSARIA